MSWTDGTASRQSCTPRCRASRRPCASTSARYAKRPRATRNKSAPSAPGSEEPIMEPVLSYNFDEIEYTVRQEIHNTSARLNTALDDLRAQIAPLQQVWTREAAEAYRIEQAKWDQAAAALNEILFNLGNAVRDGADDVANTDR